MGRKQTSDSVTSSLTLGERIRVPSDSCSYVCFTDDVCSRSNGLAPSASSSAQVN